MALAVYLERPDHRGIDAVGPRAHLPPMEHTRNHRAICELIDFLHKNPAAPAHAAFLQAEESAERRMNSNVTGQGHSK